jgi:hypothetical protein
VPRHRTTAFDSFETEKQNSSSNRSALKTGKPVANPQQHDANLRTRFPKPVPFRKQKRNNRAQVAPTGAAYAHCPQAKRERLCKPGRAVWKSQFAPQAAGSAAGRVFHDRASRTACPHLRASVENRGGNVPCAAPSACLARRVRPTTHQAGASRAGVLACTYRSISRSPKRASCGVPSVRIGVRPTSMDRSSRFSTDANACHRWPIACDAYTSKRVYGCSM